MFKINRVFYKLIKENFLLLIVAFIVAIFFLAADIVAPFLNKRIIDEGILAGNVTVVATNILYLLALSIAKYSLEILSVYCFARITSKFMIMIGRQLLESLLNKKSKFYNSYSSGEIIERFNEIWQLEALISPELLEAVFSCITFIISLYIMLTVSVKITITALTLIVVSSILFYIGTIFVSKYTTRLLNNATTTSGFLGELIKGIFEIHNLHSEHHFFGRVMHSINEQIATKMRFSVITPLWFNASSLIISITFIAILYLSGIDIISGTLTFGTYTLLLMYAQKLVGPLTQIGSIINQIQPAIIIYKRIQDIANEYAMSSHRYIEFIDDIYVIHVRNVSFRYTQNAKYIFENISLDIMRNELVILKGGNATGKTTFLNVLAGALEEYIGSIEINDKRVDNINIRNRTVSILQNPFIFKMSLRENIVLDCKYDANKYDSVIEKLRLRDYFDDGIFDGRIIDENGISLSGGQIKLIEFARCLYRDPDIILCDEISANLDIDVINTIAELLEEIKQEKIILMVEHSNHFDRLADKFVYF